MAESDVVQAEEVRPWSCAVDALLLDARPLRALFEELAFMVRATLQDNNVSEPLLTAALDLQYAGQHESLTVALPLEIESAAVCLVDPLPLDAQALRQAVAAFHAATAAHGELVLHNTPIQVVCLRVSGRYPHNPH